MALDPEFPSDDPIDDVTPTITPEEIGADCVRNPIWPSEKVTELLLLWLRKHFVAGKIENENLRDRIWVNNETTPIIIATSAEWKPTNSNQRPAILVQAHDQIPLIRGIDNRLIGGSGNEAARLRYEAHWQGMHIIQCIGGREGEAYALAGEVASDILKFQHVIRSYLGFRRFRIERIGSRMKYEEHKETWMVPISITYEYPIMWRVKRTDAEDIADILLELDNN